MLGTRSHLQATILLAVLVFSGLWLMAQAQGGASAQAKVDLNTATEQQLATLPGLDAAQAKKIITSRPYRSADDLRKAGLPAATIDRLRSRVTASSTPGATQPAPPATASKGQMRPEEKQESAPPHR